MLLINYRRITDLSQNLNLKLPVFSNASLACIKILKPNGWFQNEKANKTQTKAQGAGRLAAFLLSSVKKELLVPSL